MYIAGHSDSFLSAEVDISTIKENMEKQNRPPDESSGRYLR